MTTWTRAGAVAVAGLALTACASVRGFGSATPAPSVSMTPAIFSPQPSSRTDLPVPTPVPVTAIVVTGVDVSGSITNITASCGTSDSGPGFSAGGTIAGSRYGTYSLRIGAGGKDMIFDPSPYNGGTQPNWEAGEAATTVVTSWVPGVSASFDVTLTAVSLTTVQGQPIDGTSPVHVSGRIVCPGATPATATAGLFGNSLPYAPYDPGTTYACVVQSSGHSPLYRVNECSSHAAFVDGHFQPYVHQQSTVCYEVELNGAGSDGASTMLFTCNWVQVPEGA